MILTVFVPQLLQFLTSPRFIRMCKCCENDMFDEVGGATALGSVLDSIMGNLLTSLASVMAHISSTLDDNSDCAPIDLTDNILLLRESFCEQLQDILALLSRHRTVGVVEPDYFLLTDDWIQFLKPYENFIKSLLRRHASYDGDVTYFTDDSRSSPVDTSSIVKTRYEVHVDCNFVYIKMNFSLFFLGMVP